MPKFNIVLRHTIAIFLLLGTLTACGLKGDLYLPSKAPANSANSTASPAADAASDSDEQDDNNETGTAGT